MKNIAKNYHRIFKKISQKRITIVEVVAKTASDKKNQYFIF